MLIRSALFAELRTLKVDAVCPDAGIMPRGTCVAVEAVIVCPPTVKAFAEPSDALPARSVTKDVTCDCVIDPEIVTAVEAFVAKTAVPEFVA